MSYGERDEVVVTYRDGRHDVRALDALESLVTESGNPRNRRRIAAVDVRVPSPLLARGIELVDTPGTGSVHAHNSDEARGALERMDAAIFIVAVDPPISASERAFLAEIRGTAVRTFYVLNKADYLSPTELREALRFTAAVLADVVGEPATVHPMSARQALSARATGDPRELAASGITSFEAAFVVDYLDGRRGSDLRASVAAHASRFAAAARDADRLARTTAVLETDDLAARVVAFQARLAEVQQLSVESRALLHADIARLLGELGGAAQAQSAQLASGTRAAVERWLGQHPDGDLRQIEDSGRSMVEEQIRLGVDHWRVEQEHRLGDALSALGVRLAHRLDQQVQAVREAAADLFAVELLPPAASPALTVDRHFTYSFTDWGSITEPLAAAVRTRLPGRIGRRRVAEYLLGQIPGLADRQFGRVRADFQRRLQEAQRAYEGELAARYRETAGRLAEAVLEGQRLQAETGDEHARTTQQLNRHVEQLDLVVQLLDDALNSYAS